ncbi:MAG: serine hydrolase [candidate division KSB1 bacterium]|nr:serine hydrolase [candidate division KSB1 bacterium]
MLISSIIFRSKAFVGVFLFSSLSEAFAFQPHPSTQSSLIQKLESFIRYQMEDKHLPALSIAVVQDQQILYAKGFGYADAEKTIPATPETVYRIASVSKLFTDIAVMQRVEQGELDLDAPITEYLPDFRPENPFGKPITLRQLMSHRAGLVREPPVGSYFDPTEPPLERVIASLKHTRLVYEPGSRTKYSNAAITLLGWLLQQKTGRPYADVIREAVLEPMGLERAGFVPTPDLLRRLAIGFLWTYDGRFWPAPHFEYAIGPAANMYASMLDLAQFLKVLFRDGEGPNGRILRRDTLHRMWQPQFAGPEQKSGYGLGFYVTEYRGYKRIGHTGAVHGYATEFIALPELKIGVAMSTTRDVANSVLRQISLYAFDLLIAQKQEIPLPDWRRTYPVDPQRARLLDGTYRSQNGRYLDLVERNGQLYAWRGSMRVRVRAKGDTLIFDDALAHGGWLVPQADGSLKYHNGVYKRLPDRKPEPVPERWRALIGEYGWDHNTLYILEKRGQLHALIEWFFLYPLQEVGPDSFAFPDYGLYHGEHVVFRRDAQGNATAAMAAGIEFRRRAVGTEAGETFRIVPVKPVAELRRDVTRAQPPVQQGDFLEPDLVELQSFDPTIRYDIRYATTNNFMGARFYDSPKAFLQRPAAEALVRVHRKLKERGYGLLIHDAYRPWYVTKMFWDATPDSLKQFVADPAQGSIHNRGAAVDLTLYDLQTGKPVEMVSGYDEFSPRAFPDYPGGTSLQRWHRELLRDAMEAEGFRVYRWEWWHFNYRDAEKYPILNVRFDEIGQK